MINNGKKSFFFFIFFLGTILVAFSLFFLLTQFQIRTVIIISESSNISGLEWMNGKNLVFFDIDKMRQFLMKQNQALSSVMVIKKYPNKLIVNLQFKKPVAQLVSGQTFLYLDKDGIFLSGIKIEQILPTIEAPNISFSVDQKADWRVIKALRLLEDITKQNIVIGRIFIDDKAKMFLIYLTNGEEIVVSYLADSQKIATSLQIIITRFRIEGKFIKKIDFRFDKPVMVLSTGEKISSVDGSL